METIYSMSKKEIKRRITAYTTLILSFFCFSIVFSLNYIIQYFNIFIYIILIMAAFLLYSRVVVKKYLNSLLKTDVGLTSKYIRKNKKKYLINDIKEIIVKKTTKGCVREIKIKLNNTNTYINNSINNIDGFVIELQKYLPKEVVVKKISEPLDYDHPTFYFFFGILLSFVCINAIKLFFSLNSSNIPFISYIVSFFTIIMGIYFIVYKPIYKRDEKESKNADYLLGTIFIIGALLVLILNIFLK